MQVDIWYSRLKIIIKYFVDYFPAFTPTSALMESAENLNSILVKQSITMNMWIEEKAEVHKIGLK